MSLFSRLCCCQDAWLRRIYEDVIDDEISCLLPETPFVSRQTASTDLILADGKHCVTRRGVEHSHVLHPARSI